MSEAVSGVTVRAMEADDGYADLERTVAARVAAENGPLFETAAADLFETYLAGIPAGRRQHYRCNCCRRFIERYGGLVTIGEDGNTESILWNVGDLPDFFRESAACLYARVERSKVTGVFLSSDSTWGTPSSVDEKRGVRWSHLSATNPSVFKHALKTAPQMMAEKREDYITLKRGLDEFSIDAVRQAVRVLDADALSRGEKTLGVAKWLLALHESIAAKRGQVRDNLVWRAAATAPPGWCHVSSTMISTLLEDIVAGMDFDAVSRRWASKMHPLQYQRPTAPPSAGAIAQAEKIVAELKTAGALERRFARLEEIQNPLWLPRDVKPVEQQKSGGVFGHLRQDAAKVRAVELPAQRMTWVKFRDTVLPSACKLEFHVPHWSAAYCGVVTAVNADAPPILQWDGLAGHPRNPVSWYFYYGYSPGSRWSLSEGAWCGVNAVCLSPAHWQEPTKFTHHGEFALFVLDGCRDTNASVHGGFFPECLRSEYHGVRSVMEAYARNAAVSGALEATANGVAFQKGSVQTLRVRATDAAGGESEYDIDRWD